MNRKNRKTLEAIFAAPTLSSIKFSDIENLLLYLGVHVLEGSGSRVAFEFNDLNLFVHRPHPGKEARKYQVEAVREFIELAGLRDE